MGGVMRAQRCTVRCILALALCFVSVAAASEPAGGQALEQFHHTAWTRKQGAPAEIMAVVQTTDGWLWLGTTTGLYRFDGVRFERFDAVGKSVISLLPLPAGGLWIGYMSGGASLLQEGRITHYGAEQGLPKGPLQALALDSKGRVWASAVFGLHRFDGSRWIPTPIDAATSSVPVLAVTTGLDGSVWVRAGDGIFALREGESVFERVGNAPREIYFAAAPDGSMWATGFDGRPGRLPAHGAASSQVADTQGKPAGHLFFDREGHLWSGQSPEGLTIADGRSPSSPSDAFTKAQGLSGREPSSFFEDREGNVWVSTEGGLDRFRRTKLNALHLQGSDAAAIAAGGHGEVWVKRRDLPPVQVDGASVRELEEPPGKQLHRWTCAYRDPRGAVWLCGRAGLLRISGEKIDRVPYPAAIEGIPGIPLQALAMDGSGALWLAAGGGLLERLVDGTWTPWQGPAEWAFAGLRTMESDEAGALWLGYPNNRMIVLQGDAMRVLSSDDGLRVGDVKAIHRHGPRLWVGGSDGVALFENDRFRPITVAGAAIRGVSGIVETAAGELWLNGAEGILRIPKRELDQLLRDATHEPRAERFDPEDGLDGIPAQVRPLPTAVEGSDGRLWFATSSGLYWLDPAHIERNAVPPPVLIRGVQADDKSFEPSAGVKLPQRTKSLAISYTALSLSIPERVRFRYRLEGVDAGWQEAGTRRQAFYTNLGPGSYRFRVIAANDDGVWNDTGAALEFSIEPAFTETAWFRAVCVLLALALLYGFYRWRLVLTKVRMQERLQAQLAERERIARELHDTLLQSMSGLILHVDAATRKLPEQEPARSSFETALKHADAVLIEGRDRVLGLRTPPQAVDLADALNKLGRDLALDNAVQFAAVTPEAPRELLPAVHDEVFHIAREALLNAFRHAKAHSIRLTLSYGEPELRLSVHDDGCGIDAGVIEAGRRPGHWGLAGMHERAHKIGAQLAIHSDAGHGTRIELCVPAELAYRDFVSIFSRLWPWRSRESRRSPA